MSELPDTGKPKEPYHVMRYRPSELKQLLRDIAMRSEYVTAGQAIDAFVDTLTQPNTKLEKAVQAL